MADPKRQREPVAALCFYLERCGNVATVSRNGKSLCAVCSEGLAKYQEFPLSFRVDRFGTLLPLDWNSSGIHSHRRYPI